MKTFTLQNILSLKLSPVDEKGVRNSFPINKDNVTLSEILDFDLEIQSKLWMLTKLASTEQAQTWLAYCKKTVQYYVDQKTIDRTYYEQKLEAINSDIKEFTKDPNKTFCVSNAVSNTVFPIANWNNITVLEAKQDFLHTLTTLEAEQTTTTDASVVDNSYWKDTCPHCGAPAFDNGFSVDCKNKCH